MKNNSEICRFLAPILGGAAAVCWCASAHADYVNYGALQSLFGEPVTTSATGTALRESDVPANMTIITADDIRRSGTRNIPQIIGEYVPGIDILQESSTQFDVGVRGYQQLAQPSLLVLVDGRQVFVDDYSWTRWSNIPVNIDDIRQIEVVKGASSALFGSNAAAGVVNIVTYSPLYDKNNVVSAEIGTQNSYIGDATITRNGEWGGTKFSLGGLSAHEFQTNSRVAGSDQTPAYGPKHEYFTNSSVFPATPELKFNTEVTYSRSTENVADPLDFIMLGEDTTTYSLRAGAEWQGAYNFITFNNYFNHSLADVESGGIGVTPVRVDTNMFVSQLQDQFKIGTHHTFRAAAEYRHKDFADGGGNTLVPQTPNLDEDIYTLNGTWMWQITNKISWTNAARLDRQQMKETGTLSSFDFNTYADYSHINNAWSANSDIVYKPTDIDSFRLGYGRGVQLPSLIQSGYLNIYTYGGLPLDTEGNPHLNPTVMQDFGLDYERKINAIQSALKLSAFYENKRDVIAVINAGFDAIPAFEATFANIGSSHAWGGEASLKGSTSSGFRWAGSYSLAKVVDDPSVASSIDFQGSSPQHHFRLSGGYTTGPWEMDAFAQYVTSTNMLRSLDGGFTVNPIYTGGYTSINGRVGYNILDNMTLALYGTMLNRADAMVSPFPNVQRQVFLQLTDRF